MHIEPQAINNFVWHRGPWLDMHGQLYLWSVGTIVKPLVYEQPYVSTSRYEVMNFFLSVWVIFFMNFQGFQSIPEYPIGQT